MIRFANRFSLEHQLGSGGMARVFLGRDETLDRPVAVKILKADLNDREVGARFRREGRTAARLSHPNIVQVYDAGEAELEGTEVSYIVMEYLPGGDLKELLNRRGTLSDKELCALGAEVCAGLAHAHGRGIIHRDIKPHNILLDEHGHPKLADFGIARALDATTSNHTRTGSYLGTALYSSPEQLQGEKVTPASDIYSLGATLYQAATGHPPFTGSMISVASQHVTKAPTPPRELNAAIGVGIENVILSCLAKDPDERPTAQEVRSRLGELNKETADAPVYTAPPVAGSSSTERQLAAPPEPRPDTSGTTVRNRSTRRRGWLPWALLALIAAAVVVAAVLVAPTLTRQHDLRGKQSASHPGGGKPGKPPSGGAKTPRKHVRAQQSPPKRPSPQTTVQQPATAPSSPQSAPTQAAQPQNASEPASVAGRPDGLTQQAAAQTVEEFYNSAAAGDYGRSSDLLSTSYRQSTFPNTATFEGTFSTLQSVQFVQGPDVRLSGNTAIVTGTTIARHTDGTQRNTGMWTLVNEGGEWKISRIEVAPS